MAAVSRTSEQDLHNLTRMVNDHLESMKQVMLLPVATLMEAFPKIVRDLARDQNKDVELVIGGAEIEIDKRILEELKDPFIHLLRNCIDHSIRKPEERVGLNKTPKGIINLIFKIKDGRQLEILVSDDGEGIDTSQVREAVIKAGLTNEGRCRKTQRAGNIIVYLQVGNNHQPHHHRYIGAGAGPGYCAREGGEARRIRVRAHPGRSWHNVPYHGAADTRHVPGRSGACG